MHRGLPASLFVAAALLSPLLIAQRAASSEGDVPLRITYDAPPACPGKDVLLAHVRARSRRVRSAVPDEPARELVVTIAADKGELRGRLQVLASTDAPRQEREITSARCDELVEALGFFIALAVDPNAGASEPGPVAVPAPIPTPRPPPVAPPVPALPAAPAAPRSTAPPPAPSPSGRWHLGFGSGVVLVSGVASTVRLGDELLLSVSHTPSDDSSIVAPSIGLAATSTRASTESTALGTLALRWQSLTVAGCPIRTRPSSSLAFLPCAEVELGRLRGEGVAIAHATRNDADWIAIGLAARLELALTSLLFAQLALAGAVPLDRPHFRYSSGALAYATPAVGGRGELVLGLRF